MEFVIIKKNCEEWNYIWNWLENHPLNQGLTEPTIALNKGEAWQYMGSFKQGDIIIHQLRHRLHPLSNTRVDLSLRNSENFTEDQIMKKSSK